MKHEKDHSGMLFFVLAAGFVLVALAILFAPKPGVEVSTAGAAQQQNTISVSGASELTVSPDQAELYIRIQTEEPTANRAQEENARLTNTVREALKQEYNLDDDQIESTGYNLWPQQRWNKQTEEQEVTGYRVQHTIRITTDDLDALGDMLDTAVQNGANGVDRVSFKLSDDYEADVRDQALSRAADSAREKAESLAATLGIRLGDVSSVQESNFYYQPYDYAPRADMEMAAGAKSFSTEISPEDVTIRANLQVSYDLG